MVTYKYNTLGSNVTALKLLRQYPLVLMVRVRWAEGKALGNEYGKGIGSAEILLYSSRAVPRGWAEF